MVDSGVVHDAFNLHNSVLAYGESVIVHVVTGLS